MIQRLLIALIVSAGCTARAYPGPARPDNEIAVVDVSSGTGVTVFRVTVDGREVPSTATSVEVLPGERTLELEFRAETTNCVSTASWCEVEETVGLCDASVKTKAGKKYLVAVRFDKGSVGARVLAKGYYDLLEREDEFQPGFASCSITRTSFTSRRNPEVPYKY